MDENLGKFNALFCPHEWVDVSVKDTPYAVEHCFNCGKTKYYHILGYAPSGMPFMEPVSEKHVPLRYHFKDEQED
jgi:hypothetical protein